MAKVLMLINKREVFIPEAAVGMAMKYYGAQKVPDGIKPEELLRPARDLKMPEVIKPEEVIKPAAKIEPAKKVEPKPKRKNEGTDK